MAVYDPETDETLIANHLIYNAYGQVTSQTDPSVNTLFRFTGRPFDPATGLQNNLNRWYDAGVGRWLSEDPIGFAAADANLSRYVGNAPSIHTDAIGLYWNWGNPLSGPMWSMFYWSDIEKEKREWHQERNKRDIDHAIDHYNDARRMGKHEVRTAQFIIKSGQTVDVTYPALIVLLA